MIAIIDNDIGNIAAVANMLHRIGVPCAITAEPDAIRKADRIILPGDGSFDAFMKNLHARALVPILEEKVLGQHTPFLGICVGAQVLGSASEEGLEHGLGWVDMQVRRFPNMSNLRVPHMGWNNVRPVDRNHYLTRNLTADGRFYFIHSYYMAPTNPSHVLMEATYGLDFAAAVSCDNIIGVQFHPEKSHRFGKQLLLAFAKGG